MVPVPSLPCSLGRPELYGMVPTPSIVYSFCNYKQENVRWYQYHLSRAVRGALNCTKFKEDVVVSQRTYFPRVQIRAPRPVHTSLANLGTPPTNWQGLPPTQLLHAALGPPGWTVCYLWYRSLLENRFKTDSRGGDRQNDRAPAYLFPEPSAAVQWKLREPGTPEPGG